MSKVTSKLQVTVPKVIAERHGIKPGDELSWVSAGDSLRVIPEKAVTRRDPAMRLALFDAATRRLQKASRRPRTPGTRGWSREELYDRGRAR